MRRTRKHTKEGGGGTTDSEDPTVAGIKETSTKTRHKGQTNQKASKDKTAGNSRVDEGHDSKGSEVSRRSTVTEKCEGQASIARKEQKHEKTTSNVSALQTEKPRLNKTSKVHGEHCLTQFSCFFSFL